MSASEEIVKNEPTSNEGVSHETGEDPDLELPPPVVTRTRSGRRVRTPAALLDSEVPSLKTPSRRRKSVIQEVPCETENPADPDPEVVVVEHIAASSKPTVPSTESEPSLLTKVEVCPKPAESDKPTDITSTVPDSSAGPIPDQCNEKENNARPVPKETAPVTDRPNKTAKKRTRSESSEKREPMIPLGKPKSGRVWKDRNKQRFSALLRDKPLRSSWERKMEAKREKELVKKYSLQLKEDKAREKEDKRKRREENLKRKEENERKSEVVQVIRNTTKIKRMKKKQLRKIEKRDTLAMLQKKPPRNPKPAGKGVKGDK